MVFWHRCSADQAFPSILLFRTQFSKWVKHQRYFASPDLQTYCEGSTSYSPRMSQTRTKTAAQFGRQLCFSNLFSLWVLLTHKDVCGFKFMSSHSHSQVSFGQLLTSCFFLSTPCLHSGYSFCSPHFTEAANSLVILWFIWYRQKTGLELQH